MVDTLDTGLIKAAFGTSLDEYLCRYDTNCDGTINTLDTGLNKAAYGPCTPESPPPCFTEGP